MNVDVGTGNLVDERGLSDVGVTADEESTSGRVDRRETRHVLTNLLEVSERILLTTHDGGHTSESCLLELFASVKTVSEFEQTAVIFSNLNDEVTGSIELTKREFVVVLVVKDVEEGGKERVKVL